MKRTVFSVIRNTREISIPRKMWAEDALFTLVHPGCTNEAEGDQEPEELSRHDTRAEAVEALEKHGCSSVEYCNGSVPYFYVEEFYVEENVFEVDEDGDEEWIADGGVWEISPMPEEFRMNGDVFRWNPDAFVSAYKTGGYVPVEEDEEKE